MLRAMLALAFSMALVFAGPAISKDAGEKKDKKAQCADVKSEQNNKKSDTKKGSEVKDFCIPGH